VSFYDEVSVEFWSQILLVQKPVRVSSAAFDLGRARSGDEINIDGGSAYYAGGRCLSSRKAYASPQPLACWVNEIRTAHSLPQYASPMARVAPQSSFADRRRCWRMLLLRAARDRGISLCPKSI
jgi:hypothetical protein